MSQQLIPRRFIRPAILGATLAAALAPAAADAAVNSPVVVPGNPTCADILPGSSSLKLDQGKSGTVSDGTMSVTFTIAGGAVDWTSTEGIDAVIVKGGEQASVYSYDPEVTGGSGLSTPMNPDSGTPFDVSHVEVCFDEDAPPPPPAEEQPPATQDAPPPPPAPQPDPTPEATPPAVTVSAPSLSAPAPKAQKARVVLKKKKVARPATSARILGPRSCVSRTFRATVVGKGISRVAFYADGRKVKAMSARAGRSRYSIQLRADQGVTRVKARVKFVAGARASTKTLNVAAIRCAQRQVSPRFTG